MRLATIAAEAWVLTHLNLPCLTAGFMVLLPYTFVTIVITGKLIVLQQLMIEVYLCTFSLGRVVPAAGFFLTGNYD